MAEAKRYEIKVGEQILRGLTQEDIAGLFRAGRISSATPCRLSGDHEWRDVNEYMPLLKYGVGMPEEAYPSGAVSPRSEASVSQSSRRWKMGTAYFAAGLVCAGVVTMIPWQTVFRAIPQVPAPMERSVQPRISAAAPRLATASITASSPAARVVYSNVSHQRPVIEEVRQPVRTIVRDSGIRKAPVVSKPAPKPEEITIPLERWTTVRSAYGYFRVKIRDHGLVTISVWIDYDQPRRIEKVKGFETTGTNIVQIHSLPGAKVYYVDRIGVTIGHCVLKIIPNG